MERKKEMLKKTFNGRRSERITIQVTVVLWRRKRRREREGGSKRGGSGVSCESLL
jgi:hypothetical protein